MRPLIAAAALSVGLSSARLGYAESLDPAQVSRGGPEGVAAPGDEPSASEGAPAWASELVWQPPVLHATALFVVMRATESVLWPDPFANFDPSFVGARYRDAYTLPPKFDGSRPAFEWDGDHWTINAFGHGLLGSELYLRARECHFGWAGSLGFAAAASAVWEYVFEASGVRPSAQDLVYTPLAGLILGEARFQAARALKGRGGVAGVLRVALDPFGEAERALGAPC